MPFTATHVVPAPGLSTWPSPDPSSPEGPPLTGGLDVQLLEVTPQGWAHVACANGWMAWVDAGRLMTPAPTKAELVRQAWRAPVTVGQLAAVGGGVMILASFLPWFSAGGQSVSGWDVALYWVLFGTGDGNSGAPAGLPCALGGGFLILLAATRQRVPLPLVIGLAALGAWTAMFAASRVLRPQPHPDIGLGGLVAFLGAALVAVDVYQSIKKEHADR